MSGDSGDWFSDGYDEVDDLPEGDAGERFYLKDGQEATVIFLDGGTDDKERFGLRYNAPFAIWEAQIPTKDETGYTNWRNWATSTRGRRNKDGAPLRDLVAEFFPDKKPYYIGFYTCIVIPGTDPVDVQEIIASGGKLKKGYKKLFGAKKKALKKLQRQSARRNGLRGCVFSVARTDSGSASTGDTLDFQERLTDEELMAILPDRYKPLDYIKLLAPPTESEMRGLASRKYVETKEDRDKFSKSRKSGKSGGSGSGTGDGFERATKESTVLTDAFEEELPF